MLKKPSCSVKQVALQPIMFGNYVHSGYHQMVTALTFTPTLANLRNVSVIGTLSCRNDGHFAASFTALTCRQKNRIEA